MKIRRRTTHIFSSDRKNDLDGARRLELGLREGGAERILPIGLRDGGFEGGKRLLDLPVTLIILLEETRLVGSGIGGLKLLMKSLILFQREKKTKRRRKDGEERG